MRLRGPKPKAEDFDPQTLGQHLKKQRLMLSLLQTEVAAQIDVTVDTLRNWEKGRTQPVVAQMPGILNFLGYDPTPQPETVAERLRAKRRAMGWSIRQAASALGVDPGTWGDWERGKTILFRDHRVSVASFLGLPKWDVAEAMSGA